MPAAISKRASLASAMLTNRSKVTHEKSLFPILNHLWHKSISKEYSRYPTECKYEKAKTDQSWNSDASCIRHLKVVPRDDCADIHESAKVQQYIDDRVDFVVTGLGFGKIVTIPIQSVAGYEASK